ncbi:BglG family transcription antiterminator [Pseudolysinimonas sp.]|jgi:lichenan operon transcriptional antiterminator|uniref:BglG family transcription antiterminator n=1 Tax=Pseudolysinimonas sp. TaxID=2680009 RepID=UPI003783CB91
MADKSPMLLAYLSRSEGWTPASEIAEHLGVSTRTVRSYVTAVKVAAAPLDVILSSPDGYRLNRDAHAEFANRDRSAERVGTPRERMTFLVTRLTHAGVELDVHELADSLFVSESTIEGDLRQVRAAAREAGLDLVRDGDHVRLEGPDAGHRRLVSRLFSEEQAHGLIDLRRVQESFGIDDLSGFKTDVIGVLETQGYTINEFGLDRVLLHTAIAVERSRGSALADRAPTPGDPVAADLDRLVAERFGTRLPAGELTALTTLLTTRAGTRVLPRDGGEHVEVLRRIVDHAQEEFLVDLDDDAFLTRLGAHVGNLVIRAREGVGNPNPLARTIKSSYPLTYELAVFIAAEIQQAFDISIGEDEIAYIALHIGSHLERRATHGARLSCVLVSPGYHDIAELLERRILPALGDDVVIDRVLTRTDVDPAALQADLVISTVPWEVRPANVVIVQPLPTDADLDAVRGAITRIRRQRRRRAIADELLLYFDDALFFRDPGARDAESLIRLLGERMQERGIIDDDYLDGVLARERISSTAFTEWLAVPHALTMSAKRTAIGIALFENPIRWGEGTVQVVALVAFSAKDRAKFQTVFEQFVEVFSERSDVLRLIRASIDFPTYIDELVRLIDE